ncbi:TraR/DksA C4-type zinc finger protein [Spongiibacter sp. UBA1325]|uniref:TraR/DksA C4-type zinc finger protein n=1 Tax=Spongiibacter sp. UBA1325 TaxID=1947543 RepID=UPI002579E198|nr:TraR/DksA C4-type zinc finger protein [Spongiibacter sp. UBA1325]
MNERDFERAAELTERERQHALATHQRHQAQRRSATECEDCGQPIPKARQLAVVSPYCVECQSINEELNRHERR